MSHNPPLEDAQPVSSVHELPPYSVLMSVYEKDAAQWLKLSIESMATQSYPPDEIILVEDGSLSTEIEEVLAGCESRFPGLIRRLPLTKNVGLGEAMRIGVPECRNEWIARMDADDISAPERCKKELEMALLCGADIVGCDSEEFIGSIETPTAQRIFPKSHEELIRFSRRKVPFCHPSVMMKKSAVLRAGNYRSMFLHEDYDLFVRMFETGSIGCTVKEILFHVRVSEDFYRRRGGLKYVKTLLSFNLELLRKRWTNPSDFIIRSGGNVLFGLAPVPVRSWLYRRLLRK